MLGGRGSDGLYVFLIAKLMFWYKTNHEKMPMFDRRVYRHSESLGYKFEISYTTIISSSDMVEI